MNILEVIKREQRKLEKQAAKLQGQLEGLLTWHDLSLEGREYHVIEE